MRPMHRPNPFRDVLGINIEFPADGRCTAILPPSAIAGDGRGQLAQGAVATLCDVAMGHAIGSLTLEDEPFATVQLLIAFHSEPGQDILYGHGESPALSPGWQEVMANCVIRTQAGRTVATAQGYFARRPGTSAPLAELPSWEGAHAPSLSALIGLHKDGEGMRLRVGPALLNLDGVAHGGAVAASLDLAMRAALEDAGAPSGLALRTLDVRYILPTLAGDATVVAQVERKGRAIHFVRAQIVDPEGALRAAAVGIYGNLA